jgi:hypothetical protein
LHSRLCNTHFRTQKCEAAATHTHTHRHTQTHTAHRQRRIFLVCSSHVLGHRHRQATHAATPAPRAFFCSVRSFAPPQVPSFIPFWNGLLSAFIIWWLLWFGGGRLFRSCSDSFACGSFRAQLNFFPNK